MRRALKVAPLVFVALFGLGACGDGDGGSASSAGKETAASQPVPAGTKVSANDAPEDEIAAALEAAAIANAGKWADEIVEYRPYDRADPTFAKLRGELAKYNPGEGVVDQIVAVLEP